MATVRLVRTALLRVKLVGRAAMPVTAALVALPALAEPLAACLAWQGGAAARVTAAAVVMAALAARVRMALPVRLERCRAATVEPARQAETAGLVAVPVWAARRAVLIAVPAQTALQATAVMPAMAALAARVQTVR